MTARVYAIGIDPDTKSPAIALVSASAYSSRRERVKPRVDRVWLPMLDPKRQVNDRVVESVRALAEVSADASKLLVSRIPLSVLVVESQDDYGGKHARPLDLIRLATVTGIAAATFAPLVTPTPPRGGGVRIPRPPEWKGSIGKGIHQVRTLGIAGLEFDLEGVPGAEKVPSSKRTHLYDAIGMGIWGLEQIGVFLDRPRRFGGL